MEVSKINKRAQSPDIATFANPTVSSLTKSKDPAGVRQKLSKIDLAMFKLGKDIQLDYQKKQQLEKQSQHTSEKLLKQIRSLNQAFEQLSESVVEETQKIKVEFNREMQQTNDDSSQKIQQLNQEIQNHINQKSSNYDKIHSVLKDLNQHIQNLIVKDNQIEQDLEKIEKTIQANGEYNQNQALQLQSSYLNQFEELKQLKQENEKLDFNLGKQESLEKHCSLDLIEINKKLQLQSETIQVNSTETVKKMHSLSVTNEVIGKNTSNLHDRIDLFNQESFQQIKSLQLDIMRVLGSFQNQTQDFKNEAQVSDQNNIDTAMIYLQRDLANLTERIRLLEEFQNRQRIDIIEGVRDLEFKWNKEIGIIEDQFYMFSRKPKLFKYQQYFIYFIFIYSFFYQQSYLYHSLKLIKLYFLNISNSKLRRLINFVVLIKSY